MGLPVPAERGESQPTHQNSFLIVLSKLRRALNALAFGLTWTKPSGQLSKEQDRWQQKEIGTASLTLNEEALPGSPRSKEVHYGSSRNYN